jgi:hypothetical protein
MIEHFSPAHAAIAKIKPKLKIVRVVSDIIDRTMAGDKGARAGEYGYRSRLNGQGQEYFSLLFFTLSHFYLLIDMFFHKFQTFQGPRNYPICLRPPDLVCSSADNNSNNNV